MNAPRPDIARLFEPASVAVVGASPSRDKIGYRLMENIVQGGYKGRLYPVNPKGGEIMGRKAYPTVSAIGERVDMAVIVIPAPHVEAAVADCIKAGVGFAPVITSGFSEVGNSAGERRIVEMAREGGLGILGPNIFGIYSAACGLDATFGPGGIKPGNVAIITQSGALGIGMIGKTAVEEIGLSAIVSVGNKADVDEADLLEYLVRHDSTRVIMMYIEGIQGGARFVRAVKEATRVKPVVVIKSGRSKRGAIAAASHTGALAGADGMLNDIMKQCGILRAETVQEAFDWSRFLAESPSPAGESAVILTNGGGIGVMATDACEKYNVPLHDGPPALKKVFSGVVPEFGSTKNPIDLTGGARAEDYDKALKAGLANPDIHSVVALYCETAVFDTENLVKIAEDNFHAYRAAGKPLVYSLFGGQKTESCIAELKRRKVPVYIDVYGAVSCLGAAYGAMRARRAWTNAVDSMPVDAAALERVTSAALADGRSFLLANEGQLVMKAAGIPVPGSAVCRTIDEAVGKADEIGYPVVMKVVSRDILHKSDMGGVALHLDDRNEVMQAWEAIMHNCRTRAPKATIDGIEVAEHVLKGTELIVGARRDKALGPVLMCGLGGVYVEVLKDVAFRALPLDRSEALSMIKQTKAYSLLLGVRGEDRKDLESVLDTIIRLGSILDACPAVTDIEVNPVVVYDSGKGVKAVDSRVLISNTKGGG